MFKDKKTIQRLQSEIETLRSNKLIALNEQKHIFNLKIKELEFNNKYVKDESVKKLEEENNNLKQKIAVLQKEIEMTSKLIDLNSDIVDVKELVSKLIDKLPEIKLNNLNITNKK